MKKVYYSVTRFAKGEPLRISGVGYLTDTDLIVACISQKKTPYIRVFEDCVKKCYAIPSKLGEYKGSYSEIREIELETQNGSKDTREIELDYKIWYKFAE